MSFRCTADRGIARHVRDGFSTERADPDRAADPRRGPGRFDARVPAADHHYIEFSHQLPAMHHWISFNAAEDTENYENTEVAYRITRLGRSTEAMIGGARVPRTSRWPRKITSRYKSARRCDAAGRRWCVSQ